MTTKTTPLDSGSTDFGFTDQKGRACGYSWVITQVVYDRPTTWGSFGKLFDIAANAPVVQLVSSPTRDGKGYGPAFNRVMCRTLEEARQLAVKRADASRKRDVKKFCK
jgi:hypothetical protein